MIMKREEIPTKVTFRPPASYEELVRLLRLRYEVYAGCHLREFCSLNSYRIDVDEYDVNSHHLGLFAERDAESCEVGYVRLVTDEQAPHARWIRDLGREHSGLAIFINKHRQHPFPCFGYVPRIETIHKRYLELKAEGRRMAEPGRLAIIPGMRSLRLSRFLIESVAAYCCAFGYPAVVMSCGVQHGRVYESIGFKSVSGTGPVVPFGNASYVFAGDERDFPDTVRDRIEEMAERLSSTGTLSIGVRRASPESQQEPRTRVPLNKKDDVETRVQLRRVAPSFA
jgi:hypothetical protein